jgi:hypothetical protein
MMPPNGPKLIAKQMTQVIQGKVDDVVWKVESRRRSDSNELPDFTKEDTDVEAHKQNVKKNRLDFTM